MSYRTLAQLPVVFVAAMFWVAMLAGSAALTVVLRAENETAKLLAIAGCFAAAFAFERGEYMRRAWIFSGTCMLLLLVRDVTVVAGLDAMLEGRKLDALRGALVVGANTSGVIGAWMLARATAVAGLDDEPGAQARKWALQAVAAAVALAVTSWPMAAHFRALAAGDVDALVLIASDLGDTISLALIAPVFRTAVVMRGGVLTWTWGLLTASGANWILYDAAWGVSDAMGVFDRSRILIESFRALACTFLCAAGLAHRRAITERQVWHESSETEAPPATEEEEEEPCPPTPRNL